MRIPGIHPDVGADLLVRVEPAVQFRLRIDDLPGSGVHGAAPSAAALPGFLKAGEVYRPVVTGDGTLRHGAHVLRTVTDRGKGHAQLPVQLLPEQALVPGQLVRRGIGRGGGLGDALQQFLVGQPARRLKGETVQPAVRFLVQGHLADAVVQHGRGPGFFRPEAQPHILLAECAGTLKLLLFVPAGAFDAAAAHAAAPAQFFRIETDPQLSEGVRDLQQLAVRQFLAGQEQEPGVAVVLFRRQPDQGNPDVFQHVQDAALRALPGVQAPLRFREARLLVLREGGPLELVRILIIGVHVLKGVFVHGRRRFRHRGGGRQRLHRALRRRGERQHQGQAECRGRSFSDLHLLILSFFRVQLTTGSCHGGCNGVIINL